MLTGFADLKLEEQLQHMCLQFFGPDEKLSVSMIRDKFRNKKTLTNMKDPAQKIAEALLKLKEKGLIQETTEKGNEKYRVSRGAAKGWWKKVPVSQHPEAATLHRRNLLVKVEAFPEA